MNFSRRRFLRALSASPLLTYAGATAASGPAIPVLRKLAAGRPLIGAAVPSDFKKSLNPADLEILRTQFDSVTPENCMKWQHLCPKEGDYRFDPADRLVALAKANGQKVVGHTLIFNRDGNYPDWILRTGGKEADSKLLWKRIEEHVGKIMTRYKGRIASWDVLNEFVEVNDRGYRETDFTRILGKDYPPRLFKLAAEIDPKAKLTYNDYSVEIPGRRKAILAFVRSLQDSGCRVDVVGNQAHLEIGEDVGKNIDATIKEFAKLGISSALTELDIDVVSRKHFWNPKTRAEAIKQDPYANGCPDEILQKQAENYRDVFQAVMANRDHVERVTFWGITDRRSWLNTWPWKRVNYGLLFDRDSEPKPAFHAVAKVLRKG